MERKHRSIMKIARLVIVVTCMVVPLDAGKRLRLHVSASGSPRSNMLIQTMVEPEAENRQLEAIADSDDFFGRSVVDLEGERAARVNIFRFSGVPRGIYNVRVTVLDRDGHERASEEQWFAVAGSALRDPH
jgi:hypothetical protein